MSFREENIFWRLIIYFIEKRDFRIIQLSKSQKEIWLEKLEDKDIQVVRILLHSLDWSSWLGRDMNMTLVNGENIRKQLRKRNLHILNIYVTPYPPVDDYDFRIKNPILHPKGNKTKITSIISDRQNGIHHLESILNDSIEIEWKENVDEGEIENVKQRALQTAQKKIKSDKALFQNGKPFFTYLFIFLQVFIFILMEIAGGSKNTSVLIDFGAKVNWLILDGEWWRLLSPVVLHIGALHLAMNTFALYYIGSTVERIFGRTRFLFIYLFAGFSGSIGSLLFSPSISAGASGAIFGCFGALLYFGTIYRQQFLRTMGVNTLLVIGINLIFGFTFPGIDNAGHIGGLVGGFLASAIVHFPKKKRAPIQLGAMLLSIGLLYGLIQYSFAHPEQLVNEESSIIMAQDYLERGQFDKAYEILSQQINDNEGSANTLFLLSYTEIKTGRLDEAIDHLHQVIERKSDFHEAVYNLSLVYFSVENYEKAKEYAQRAMDIQPSNKDYKKLLDEINIYVQ